MYFQRGSLKQVSKKDYSIAWTPINKIILTPRIYFNMKPFFILWDKTIYHFILSFVINFLFIFLFILLFHYLVDSDENKIDFKILTLISVILILVVQIPSVLITINKVRKINLK